MSGGNIFQIPKTELNCVAFVGENIPALLNPASAEPTLLNPASADPTLLNPTSAEPALLDPAPTEPTLPSPTAADPICRAAIQPAVDYIKQRCNITPLVGIICGSGLGELGELVVDPVSLDYRDIPGFPVSTAPGHKGRLILGYLNSVPVVLMQGRLHCYEGFPLWKIALPVRVMKLLGIKNIIITNAVGAINQSYNVGDIMLVKDHINFFGLAGLSPLQGPNDDFFGPRFFDVGQLYNERLRSLAKESASEVGMSDKIQEGVLTLTGGPNYETTAELKMFSLFGIDCVGMSSIPESLAAHHCGLAVLAFCLITNLCSTEYNTGVPPNHEEVLEVAGQRKDDLKTFVNVLVKKISDNQDLSVNGGVVL